VSTSNEAELPFFLRLDADIVDFQLLAIAIDRAVEKIGTLPNISYLTKARGFVSKEKSADLFN
jgi:hypothetical protein